MEQIIQHHSKARGAMPITSDMPSVGFPLPSGLVVSFERGIPGFEIIRNYRYVAYEEARPFMSMEALDPERVRFVCVDTFAVCPDYRVVLPGTVVDGLDIHSREEVVLMSIVTMTEGREPILQ